MHLPLCLILIEFLFLLSPLIYLKAHHTHAESFNNCKISSLVLSYFLFLFYFKNHIVEITDWDYFSSYVVHSSIYITTETRILQIATKSVWYYLSCLIIFLKCYTLQFFYEHSLLFSIIYFILITIFRLPYCH